MNIIFFLFTFTISTYAMEQINQIKVEEFPKTASAITINFFNKTHPEVIQLMQQTLAIEEKILINRTPELIVQATHLLHRNKELYQAFLNLIEIDNSPVKYGEALYTKWTSQADLLGDNVEYLENLFASNRVTP